MKSSELVVDSGNLTLDLGVVFPLKSKEEHEAWMRNYSLHLREVLFGKNGINNKPPKEKKRR